MSDGELRPRRKWPYVVGILAGLLAGLVIFVSVKLRNLDDRVRDWVVVQLQQKFQSDVDLGGLHVRVLPDLGVTGEDLSLRLHNRKDLPPMFHVAKFSFNLGWTGILDAPHHISGIYVENMTITIPPRGEKHDKPPAPKKKFPEVTIDEIVINDTDLVIMPKKQGKAPLDFDIHDLVLKSVGPNKPFDFHGNLTNAKPQGEIATRGTFGPWSADEPGDTPLTGTYKFTDADLGPFPGIAGTLSSTGDFKGKLNEIEVAGKTDTPNFSLDPVGHAVPLHTDFSATVDGTDGDTYLHPVRAKFLHSSFTANGKVVRVKNPRGHDIELDVVMDHARVEDLLQLGVKTDPPILSGNIQLKTRMVLGPGEEDVANRLKLDGNFNIPDGKFSNQKIQDRIDSLSLRSQGKPKEAQEHAEVGVPSNLDGTFHLEKGLFTFSQLNFSVPGTNAEVEGQYSLDGNTFDFHGKLKLEATLSHMMTGWKSVLLKPVDPFFHKNGSGTEVPFKVTGTRSEPHFGLDFGKHDDKNGSNDKPEQNRTPSQ